MSDIMKPVPFVKLINSIVAEFDRHKQIFSIPEHYFFIPQKDNEGFTIFGERIDTPVGPAAGPHTQLAQNIVSAFLTGGRFFELKTVQILDELVIDKPCIDAGDECYNVEWSQELKLKDSYDEYLKAWLLLHFLDSVLGLNKSNNRGFVFNMSVGYNLEGIKTEPMDRFINQLKDASINDNFDIYKNILIDFINANNSSALLNKIDKNILIDKIKGISPYISSSMTLSTMHGCPPAEIDSIARYLIKEKRLNTYVKLNPTLLGYEVVRNILDSIGFNYIELDPVSFDHDLKFEDAIPMIKGLQEFAKENKKIFGVKLSNTLGTINKKQLLAGESMYMSGRSLFPLTIKLAHKLSDALDGNINISYSGGATVNNCVDILSAGIYPITLATDLLKPGGYLRLKQIADKVSEVNSQKVSTVIDTKILKQLSDNSLLNKDYNKETREINSIKLPTKLEHFDCFISPCSAACPIHQDVSEYISLVEEGRYKDAFKTIINKNPLPFITGYICDHQCMTKCTRWDYDRPVTIRDIKKEAAIKGYPEYLDEFKSEYAQNDNGIKAAVIGAGPAGLAAAYFLVKHGFKATIFEKTDKAGGTVQHTIPDFRLPQEAIDNDIEFIKMHGVDIVYNSENSFNIESLKSNGYKYIFIGIGAGLSNAIELSGDNKNIYDAVDFLQHYNKKQNVNLGKNVAVIGGGNSAIDGARGAKRTAGVEKVYIIYRRTKEFMPADKEELIAAEEDGVIFKELLLPIDFTGNKLKCQKMQFGEMDTDGRRKVYPLENEYEYLEIDSVISAIGEKVEKELLVSNGLLNNEDNRIKTNLETGETIIENVYIGGDAYRGPSTVIESIADGRKAADAIIKKEGLSISEPKYPELDLTERIKKAVEAKGVIYTNKNSSGCLNCNILCSKCVDVCPNRANRAIRIDSSEFNNEYQILHLDSLCNECGNCETFCPHTGKPYRDKITVFYSKEEFEDSTNDGFLIQDEISIKNITLRLNKCTYKIVFDESGKLINNENSVSGKYIEFIKTCITEYSYLL